MYVEFYHKFSLKKVFERYCIYCRLKHWRSAFIKNPTF